jgi:hypothetical protein
VRCMRTLSVIKENRMTRLTKVLFTAALSVAAMAGTALADDEPAKGGEGGGGDASGGGGDAAAGGEAKAGDAAGGAADAAADAGMVSGLTLGKGKIAIMVNVGVNLSADLVGKPFSIAPSIYYGVSDKLQIGLVHDFGSTMYSPHPQPGAGLCLAGKDNGCAKVYDNVGIDALFGVAQGKFSAAVHGGVDITHISDPLLADIRVGLLGKYDVNDKIAVAFDPFVAIGVTKRDEGNFKQLINVPVYLWFHANPKLAAYAATGITGPTDHFGDLYVIPVGIGATYMVNDKISAGGDFWFTNLAGKNSSADGRALGIRVGYAL